MTGHSLSIRNIAKVRFFTSLVLLSSVLSPTLVYQQLVAQPEPVVNFSDLSVPEDVKTQPNIALQISEKDPFVQKPSSFYRLPTMLGTIGDEKDAMLLIKTVYGDKKLRVGDSIVNTVFEVSEINKNSAVLRNREDHSKVLLNFEQVQ